MNIRLSSGILWVTSDESDEYRVNKGADRDPRQITIRDKAGDNTIHLDMTPEQLRRFAMVLSNAVAQ